MEQQEGQLREAGSERVFVEVNVCWRGQCGGMFLVLCVLIGRLPDPGVSTPAHLSVAAVGVSFIKIQNEPRGYSRSVWVCVCMCVWGGWGVGVHRQTFQTFKAAKQFGCDCCVWLGIKR